MDLNYVFLRQQVERSLANASASEAARRAHEELARAYELQIERLSGGRIVFPWDADDEQELSVLPTPSGSS
jgi:hypothetical protein